MQQDTTQIPESSQPLPTLVDFRLNHNQQRVVLFVQEGKAFYTKRLDLSSAGAGLWAINPVIQNATFVRRQRPAPSTENKPSKRAGSLGAFSLSVSREMAELLAQVFWGRLPDPEKWAMWEGVQPACLNAAD